jgi:hypothetical protein
VTARFVVPDLVATAVSDPPATLAPAARFSASDTVRNEGTVQAGASRTRFYLAAAPTRGPADVLLGGSRTVPQLAPGASSTVTATLTLPSAVPPRVYHLLACADDLQRIAERDDAGNNCLASSSRTVIGP